MHRYSTYTDQELAALLQTGDNKAYTEIYHRYKRPLYQFAFKRLGDKEEVNDILHDLFLNLWIKHQDLNLSHTLSTYLHSAVRHRIINHIAHQQVAARYTDSFELYVATVNDNTDHLIRDKQLSTLIEQEVNALPSKMQQVFQLSRQTGLNRREIAEELSLSEQTVKSHIQHALKILKMKLGPLLMLILFVGKIF